MERVEGIAGGLGRSFGDGDGVRCGIAGLGMVSVDAKMK